MQPPSPDPDRPPTPITPQDLPAFWLALALIRRIEREVRDERRAGK